MKNLLSKNPNYIRCIKVRSTTACVLTVHFKYPHCPPPPSLLPLLPFFPPAHSPGMTLIITLLEPHSHAEYAPTKCHLGSSETILLTHAMSLVSEYGRPTCPM